MHLTEVSVVGGGDSLLAQDFGSHSLERMIPSFLNRVGERAIRLGITQRLLQSHAAGLRNRVSVRSIDGYVVFVSGKCALTSFPIASKMLSEPLRIFHRLDQSTEVLHRLEEQISDALQSHEEAKEIARLQALQAKDTREAEDAAVSPSTDAVLARGRVSPVFCSISPYFCC